MYMCMYLSFYLSIYLFIHPSIHLFISLSLSLSLFLSLSLSLYTVFLYIAIFSGLVEAKHAPVKSRSGTVSSAVGSRICWWKWLLYGKPKNQSLQTIPISPNINGIKHPQTLFWDADAWGLLPSPPQIFPRDLATVLPLKKNATLRQGAITINCPPATDMWNTDMPGSVTGLRMG